MRWIARHVTFDFHRPILVIGIINATPDSFADSAISEVSQNLKRLFKLKVPIFCFPFVLSAGPPPKTTNICG